MSLLKEQVQYQLEAVELLIAVIKADDYSAPIAEMGSASIGQHVRHTLEIIQELFSSYDSGIINYSNRKRDHRIETIPAYALRVCRRLKASPDRADKILVVHEEDASARMSTTYSRELHFVLDHTIHHMALIKTGLRIIGKDTTDATFGMAYSTLKHRNAPLSIAR